MGPAAATAEGHVLVTVPVGSETVAPRVTLGSRPSEGTSP